MLRSAQRQLKEQAMLAFASLSSCGSEAAELLPKGDQLRDSQSARSDHSIDALVYRRRSDRISRYGSC